ncbi:MAG: response regulator [Desulfomonilaceae bacterium]
MGTPLKLLIVEDDENDALLEVNHLELAGFDVTWKRVETYKQMMSAIQAEPWDIIISDHNMPKFSGPRALKLLVDSGLDIPLITVSGAIGEQMAVESMKAGAKDYILKNNLSKLGVTIIRELKEAADRKARKAAEAALKEAEQINTFLVEKSPVGIGIVQGSLVMYANPAMAKIFGANSVDELVGKPMEELFPPELRQTALQKIQARPAEDEFRAFFLGQILTIAGDVRDAAIWQSVIPYKGEPAIMFILADLTEEKRLRNQLFQAQKMEDVGTLASGIAHDFNNILAVISGYSQLLMLDKTLSPKVLDNIRQIYQASDRAADLIKRLMAFSRKSPSAPQPTDINERIQQTTKLLKHSITQSIEIKLNLPPHPVVVKIDPNELGQSLMNLAVNARDAMPDGGVLTFSVEEIVLDNFYCRTCGKTISGPYARLAVADTGLGMSENVRNNIFEPFFTTKEEGKGTGLGLAMVRSIVEENNGHVDCVSEIGVGTTFEILAPLVPQEAQVHVTVQEQSLIGGSETILFVDDEQAIREMASHMLQTHGYKVLVAENGERAIDIYRENPETISLVIMDYNMPHMMGDKSGEKLLEIDPNLKIVMCSGRLDAPTMQGSLMAKSRGLIKKPFEINNFLRTIRDILDSE